MKLIIPKNVKEDILNIYYYIAMDSKFYANKTVKEILKCFLIPIFLKSDLFLKELSQ